MKKFLFSIVSLITLIGGRIFASPEYGVPRNEIAYGIPEPPSPSIVEVILDVLKIAFIPVTLIIGLIVFITIRRKKKSGKGDKDE